MNTHNPKIVLPPTRKPPLAQQWLELDLEAAAQRVVDIYQFMHDHQTQAPSMDAIVESIRLKPQPPARHGEHLALLITVIAFIAGWFARGWL